MDIYKKASTLLDSRTRIITGVVDKNKVFKTNQMINASIISSIAWFLIMFYYVFYCSSSRFTTENHTELLISMGILLLIFILVTVFSILYYKNRVYIIRFTDEDMIIENNGRTIYSFNIKSNPRLLIDLYDHSIGRKISNSYLSIQQGENYFQIPCACFEENHFYELINNLEMEFLATSSEQQKLASAPQEELSFEKDLKDKEFHIIGVKDSFDKNIIYKSPIFYKITLFIFVAITYLDAVCINKIIHKEYEGYVLLAFTLGFQLLTYAIMIYFKRRCMYTLKFGDGFFMINNNKYNYKDYRICLYVRKGLRETPGKKVYYLLDQKTPFYSVILKIPEDRLNCLDPLWVSLDYDINEKSS